MDTKPRIIADCDIPFLKGVLEPYARMLYLRGSEISHADALEADVLMIRTRTHCDRALLQGTPVRLIATATIGHDHIDFDYCLAHGIDVATAEGCNARGVLQYVMAALAVLSRTEGWRPEQKTLGIVGVGNVGSLIAGYGRQFGFRVLCCDPLKKALDPTLDYMELYDMLPQCDIVTCHVPLSRSGSCPTQAMASERFFAAMKRGALFFNTSRGGVVSDAALTAALQSRRVGRAVIDTWNNEPDIDPVLLRLAAFASPHIAGYSLQGKAAGTAAVVKAVCRRYGLPLDGWYPPQVAPGHGDPQITWDGMREEMPCHFDIEAESERLKNHPERFESIRNDYDYRTEFF